MAIQVEHVGDVAVVTTEGVPRGSPEADELQNILEELVRQGQKKVLLNLQNTSFMTSHAIGVLIGAHKSAKEHGIAFYVCCMHEHLMKVVKICRYTRPHGTQSAVP